MAESPHANRHADPHADSDYLGSATIVIRGEEIAAQIELRGYREPIDGVFRWIGRIQRNDRLTELLGDDEPVRATIRTTHSAREALVGDPDPWLRYRIVGKSTPPFPVVTRLDEIDPSQ